MNKSDTRHPQYTVSLPDWKLCRDAVIGERRVKEAGFLYLPPQGVNTLENSKEYKAYKQRPSFHGMTEATVETLVGIAFQQEPKIENENWGAIEYLNDNADGAGTTLTAFMKFSFNDVVTTGRGGILVDYPKGDGNETALTDKDKKAYMKYYPTESIVDWDFALFKGSNQLSRVVLIEVARKEGTESNETEFRYREIYRDLDEESETKGQILGVLYGDDDRIIEKYEINVAGNKTPSEIPFYLMSDTGDVTKVGKPPVLKIANTNMDHWRVSAEMKMAMHYHSMPQPVISGATPAFIARYEDKPLVIGTTEILMLDQGMTFDLVQMAFSETAYHSELARLVNTAVELGARLTMTKSGGVESAESIRLNQAGDISTMASIINSVNSAFNKSINMVADFMGETIENPDVTLNTELLKSTPDAAVIAAITSAIQQTIVPGKVLRDYFRSVGVVDSDTTEDALIEEIANTVTGVEFSDDLENSSAIVSKQ